MSAVEAIAVAADVKEVTMDVPAGGGARATRRRGAGGRRRRRTARAEDEEMEGGMDAVVEKAEAVPSAAPKRSVVAAAPAPAPAAAPAAPAKPAVVVLAPAKKKPAKLMLVPKSGAGHHATAGKMAAAKKTFKAKRVRVTIDNTAKTVKHRRQLLQKVDMMTDDQVRGAAVAAKLARREKVATVPITLLRQMLRDYQTMRGMLL